MGYVFLVIVIALFSVTVYTLGQQNSIDNVVMSCAESNGVNLHGDYYYCTLLEEGQ